jgi:hypothetical protein
MAISGTMVIKKTPTEYANWLRKSSSRRSLVHELRSVNSPIFIQRFPPLIPTPQITVSEPAKRVKNTVFMLRRGSADSMQTVGDFVLQFVCELLTGTETEERNLLVPDD